MRNRRTTPRNRQRAPDPLCEYGVLVCPSRTLDGADEWTETLIGISDLGRKGGKSVALHTHFNHPGEISWITEWAALRLFENAVTVRNQSMLLNGVNNDVGTMKLLIRRLIDNNIQPVRLHTLSQHIKATWFKALRICAHPSATSCISNHTFKAPLPGS